MKVVIARRAQRDEEQSRSTCACASCARLLRRFAPRKKRVSAGTASGCLGERLKLDGESELGELGNQTFGFEVRRTRVEVGIAEVAVFDAVLEHMVDRREERSSDSADCFLGSASALQTEELGSVVAALFAFGRPGALDEHRLEPGRPLAQTRGPALSGTLVVTRAHAGPSEKVACGRKPAHVVTDLGKNRRRRDRAHSRGCMEEINQGAKGGLLGPDLRLHAVDALTDLTIDVADRCVQAVPLPQVEIEQE